MRYDRHTMTRSPGRLEYVIAEFTENISPKDACQLVTSLEFGTELLQTVRRAKASIAKSPLRTLPINQCEGLLNVMERIVDQWELKMRVPNITSLSIREQ